MALRRQYIKRPGRRICELRPLRNSGACTQKGTTSRTAARDAVECGRSQEIPEPPLGGEGGGLGRRQRHVGSEQSDFHAPFVCDGDPAQHATQCLGPLPLGCRGWASHDTLQRVRPATCSGDDMQCVREAGHIPGLGVGLLQGCALVARVPSRRHQPGEAAQHSGEERRTRYRRPGAGDQWALAGSSFSAESQMVA